MKMNQFAITHVSQTPAWVYSWVAFNGLNEFSLLFTWTNLLMKMHLVHNASSHFFTAISTVYNNKIK